MDKTLRNLIVQILVALGFSELGRPLTEEELRLRKEYYSMPRKYRTGKIQTLTPSDIEEIEIFEEALEKFDSLPESTQQALISGLPLDGLTVACRDAHECTRDVTKLLIDLGASIHTGPLSEMADLLVYYRVPAGKDYGPSLHIVYRNQTYDFGCPHFPLVAPEIKDLAEHISLDRKRALIKAS